MHCDEVIRELAAPTDDRDSASLFEHLATCPSCTGWAKRASHLDRLWQATRPTEPSPEVWDTVWAQVTSSLDSGTPAEVAAFLLPMASANGSMASGESPVIPAHSSARSRPWSWTAIGLIGVAQAAAILIVMGLTWQRTGKPEQPTSAKVVMSPSFLPAPAGSRDVNGPSAVSVVEIDEGQLVVIHVKGSDAQVVDLTPQAASHRLEESLRTLESAVVDDWLYMLNAVESMTKPLVAMKE